MRLLRRLLVAAAALTVALPPLAIDARPAQGEVKGADKSKPLDKGKDRKKKQKKQKRGSIPSAGEDHHHPSLPLVKKKIACPDEMVAVGGRVCVDRFEATLVEVETHAPLSPFYPPTARLAAWSLEKWTAAREQSDEGTLAREMPLPPLPDFEKDAFAMRAMSWPGSTPSGYVTGQLAAQACRASGKRLCSEAEWVTACRGEKQTHFPYGASYRQDTCNVFREDHPASLLHGDPSTGHSDPRLNLVSVEGKALLRDTGNSPRCASKWGDDAIFDMVGNLDEWVDDAEGTFLGGFYSRASRSGCDARVRTHPVDYFDYSTGVRCCKDPD